METKQLQLPDLEKLLLEGVKAQTGWIYIQKVLPNGRIQIIAVKRPPEQK